MVDVIDDKINIDDQNQSNTIDKQDIYSTKTYYVGEAISMMVFIGLIIVTYKYNPLGKLFATNMLSAVRIQYLSIMLYFLVFDFIVYYYDLFYATESNYDWYIILSLVIGCFLFAVVLFYFVAYSKHDIYQSGLTKFPTEVISLFQFIIGVSFTILLVIFITMWISNKSTTLEIIFNLLIILTLLTLVYNILSKSAIFRSSPVFRMIVNFVLWLPCLFSDILDRIISQYYIEKDVTRVQEVILLVIGILLVGGYYSLPYLTEWLDVVYQGGRTLVNEPIILKNPYTIGAYISLNDINPRDSNPVFEYNYAVSMWLYLDALPPNTGAAFDKYTPVFSYGGKPTISYKASNNTMLVTAQIKDITEEMVDNLNLERDVDDNVIIYKLENVLLQKWNHILINYNGGILDVFYNGELVKSAKNIVPYMKLDSMVVGTPNGVNGAICNVMYYKHVLEAKQIAYLYNSVKNSTPPTRTFAPANKDLNEINLNPTMDADEPIDFPEPR
jgi:hypothetical protein